MSPRFIFWVQDQYCVADAWIIIIIQILEFVLLQMKKNIFGTKIHFST